MMRHAVRRSAPHASSLTLNCRPLNPHDDNRRALCQFAKAICDNGYARLRRIMFALRRYPALRRWAIAVDQCGLSLPPV